MKLDLSLPSLLLAWYADNRRTLPWRLDQEPYHVWLSEIMLQQTRVEAVKAYYARFLAELPDIPSLAVCEEDKLYKLWEGLGYYSRVRNLKKAAQQIMTGCGGQFPSEYAAVRALPGIGDYTAGAICSICFGLPTPAVDGNVLRVVTRLTACQEDIMLPATKRLVTTALAALYPPGYCGDFTQALMELGALICLPNQAPRCEACPLRGICAVSGTPLWRDIPVRAAKKPRKPQEWTVFIMDCDGCQAVRRRQDSGLLGGVWEFPSVSGLLTAQQALSQSAAWGCEPTELIRQTEKRHVFTHLEWRMRGFYIRCQRMPNVFVWADQTMLNEAISLPTAFRQFREPMPQ